MRNEHFGGLNFIFLKNVFEMNQILIEPPGLKFYVLVVNFIKHYK